MIEELNAKLKVVTEVVPAMTYYIAEDHHQKYILKNNLERAKDKSTFFSDFSVKEGEYLLFTCHKSINTDDSGRLRKILTALSKLEQKVIFPLHPRTRNKLQEFN